MDRDFMSASEYQRKALEFERASLNEDDRLLEGLMGLCGETGEAMDILKKAAFQGHDLDIPRLALELGDVMWYLSLAADAIGYTLNDIFRLNLEKLSKRYPNGFNEQDSINRTGE